MSLSTQLKLLNSVREFLMEEGKIILPTCSEPKPDFPHGSPKGRAMPRCTPEEAGLDSHLLESFCRELAKAPNANPHSLLILRNGKIVCEGYFSPYNKDSWHICHSLSKSFVGTAVGIALSEGHFHIEDPLTEHFSDSISLLGRRRMKEVTVRHLLNMTSGISFNELSELVEPDWLRGILSSSLASEPGTHFEYNSMNSYLLAALLKRTTGQCVMEYLKPRLFEPLGFGPIAWETCPSGIEKGGWGIYAMAEDLAKLGQLYLNFGHWTVDGKDVPILPERWVREATSRQAEGDDESYGFQMWVDQETGFPVMNGMFGQYIAMIPPQNICIVMTAGCPRLFHESPTYSLLRQFFYHLPPLPETLPANPVSYASLQRTLQALRFRHPVPTGPRRPAIKQMVTRGVRWNSRPLREPEEPEDIDSFLGTTWRFSQNRAGLLPVIVQAMDNNFTAGVSALRLERAKEGLMLYWEEDKSTICLPVGLSKPAAGQLRIGEETFLTACFAELKQNEDDEPVLRIEVCLTEHSSLRMLKLQRQGDNLCLRLDEHPQINAALGMAMDRKGDGLAELQGAGPGLSSLIKSNDFLQYRINQLFTPEVIGIPT